MTFNEAVDFYHSLERFGIKPGLERIERLVRELGSPHKKLKFIHVAGTNGKGSTCTALASVLCKAGYNTGLYTSPYVLEFRERIQYNMEMISREDLVFVTEKVSAATEKLHSEGISVTEFEAVTAAAFLYFAEKGCDYVVLETGLGGRFDATNIISSPLCSIIVSVSLDHTNILGNTLGEIAFEKCGIIKEGCPVITGEEQPSQVLKVIKDQSEIKNSPLYTANSEKMLTVKGEYIYGTEVSSEEGAFLIPWSGRHQLNNMSLVLTAVNVLRSNGVDISFYAVREGISSASIPARTEILSRDPLVILDGSHNEGSVRALSKVLKRHLDNKRIIAVMGMMADKDISVVLSELVDCFQEVITVKPSNPRSMDAEELCEMIIRAGTKGFAVSDPSEGIRTAFGKINGFDALVVCGSLYLAGDVRELLTELCGKHDAADNN